MHADLIWLLIQLWFPIKPNSDFPQCALNPLVMQTTQHVRLFSISLVLSILTKQAEIFQEFALPSVFTDD